MKILNSIKRIIFGSNQQAEKKLTPAQKAEIARIRRRLEKFPRLRHAPNPQAHRADLFKERHGIF